MNELHLHIDGSIRRSTLQEWCPNIDIKSFGFRRGMNLSDCLSCFSTTVEALSTPERMQRAVQEICEDQKKYGVKKSELRFAPHIHKANPEEMIDAAIRGLDNDATLILCGLYGFEPKKIEQLVDWAKSKKKIVGIDIAGGPNNSDKYGLRDYVDAYKEALNIGVGRTVHVGEGRGSEEIVEAIKTLNVNRIGHACSLLESPEATALVLDRKITVEACPTSNVHTGIYSSPSYHPIKEWISAGIRVSICADNSLMSATNTISELWATRFFSSLSDGDVKWVQESSTSGLFSR